MAKVKITETVLRDGHQSLIATRMTTEEMLPILETMDQVGYHALEMWGGKSATALLDYRWDTVKTIIIDIVNDLN